MAIDIDGKLTGELKNPNNEGLYVSEVLFRTVNEAYELVNALDVAFISGNGQPIPTIKAKALEASTADPAEKLVLLSDIMTILTTSYPPVNMSMLKTCAYYLGEQGLLNDLSDCGVLSDLSNIEAVFSKTFAADYVQPAITNVNKLIECIQVMIAAFPLEVVEPIVNAMGTQADKVTGVKGLFTPPRGI